MPPGRSGAAANSLKKEKKKKKEKKTIKSAALYECRRFTIVPHTHIGTRFRILLFTLVQARRRRGWAGAGTSAAAATTRLP
jgi:hypothetical protein